MNADAKRQISQHATPTGISSALVVSLLFHAAVIVVGTFGLPFITRQPEPISAPIPIEMVEISDRTMTDKPVERAAIKPTEDEKKEPPKPEPERPKQAPKQTAETPPRPSSSTVEEVTLPDKAKPPEKKLEKPVEKPPTPKRRPAPVETAKEPSQEDMMQALLKNLQEAKPDPAKGEGTAAATSQQAQPLPLGERLTISERDALALQLRNCWNVLAGARYAENLVVDIKMFMNPDGTLQRAVIVDQIRYNTDSIFRAAADSAMRAVRDPNCTPLRLPPGKYNDWKVINATFDPSQIL